MPELPEVEVTRRSFAERIAGAEVLGVRLGAPLRWPLGCDPESLIGFTVGAAERRGKYLWLPMQRRSDAGRDEEPVQRCGLLIHLGMSGSLQFSESVAEPSRHDHFDLLTTRGTLRLTDPRRFGAVVWSASRDEGMAAKLLAPLGAEPFDVALTPRRFHEALKARRAPIKAVLLSGDIVVGAGNIYACEALFGAGIDPRTPSHRIGPARAQRLLACLRATLARALELGGSTLRDFRDAHGMSGEFQSQAQVYGRAGEACARCGATIRRLVQGQRSTFFCPGCQRR